MELIDQDIFTLDVEALVNPVNTVGVMGKGLAKRFAESFPEMFKAYKKACERKELKIGEMWVWETGFLWNPCWVVNFPTKEHWKYQSKLSYIERGLYDLRYRIDELGVQSVAVPALGCGAGNLKFDQVLPLIEKYLSDVNAKVLVCAP
jgi:O-acetyl-ADP-ribose deacetylase (regulator of RNase III)